MAATCSFCELPLVSSPSDDKRAGGAPSPRYCCYGCRFAAEVTQAAGDAGAINWALVRLGLAIFFAMNVMVFTMALWSQDVYDGGSADHALKSTFFGLFRYLCMLFALPVLLLLGRPLLENALVQLRRGYASTDLLLLLGVAASYLYSVASVFADNHGPVYFEVGCMVLVLVTLGRWLEANGKLQANSVLDSLQKLLPERVRILSGQREEERPLAETQAGMQLRVLAGERVPCDGTVLRHAVHVDEQILTGESVACTREPGETVWAGTLNLDSELYLEVSATPGEGALDRLMQLVREAREQKGHYELAADRLSRWFLPVVVVIAGISLVVHGWTQGWHAGLMASLAVVLIACPCSLGIATPLAVWVALGHAARRRVLFQSGAVLEQLAGLKALAFDKTGTLTTGASPVRELCLAEGEDRDDVLRQAARLAQSSTHGLARGIVDFARLDASVHAPDEILVETFSVVTLPGRGLRADTAGAPIFLGSPRLMAEQGQVLPAELATAIADVQRQAYPQVCVGWGGRVRGIFVHREQLRAEASEALRELQSLGLQVTVLTGDDRARGDALASELHLPVQAGQLPEDKLKALSTLREQWGPVGMVGDGINDSPALAGSDVGIAMGCGADVARASAGLCLLGDDLMQIPWALKLARRTVRTVRQNLFWAFAYNSVGIALAALGWLNPVWAALAMVLSSLFVVANSLRLSSDGGGAAVASDEWRVARKAKAQPLRILPRG